MQAPARRKCPLPAGKVSRWGLPSPQQGVCPYYHLPILLLVGSGLAGATALLDRAASPSAASEALSLFRRCRSADGAGAFLLLLEATSLQPASSILSSHLCNCISNVLCFSQHNSNDERGIDGQSLYVHPHLRT